MVGRACALCLTNLLPLVAAPVRDPEHSAFKDTAMLQVG